FRLDLHEVAVHQKQALERNRRNKPFFSADAWTGEIEELQIFIQLVSADFPVNRTAQVSGSQIGGRASHGIRDVAGSEGNAIAKLLCVEGSLLGRPVQTVSGILRGIFRIIGGTELIHRTQHDRPLKPLYRHSVIDEVMSEILEQLWICRTLAGSSEIAR